MRHHTTVAPLALDVRQRLEADEVAGVALVAGEVQRVRAGSGVNRHTGPRHRPPQPNPVDRLAGVEPAVGTAGGVWRRAVGVVGRAGARADRGRRRHRRDLPPLVRPGVLLHQALHLQHLRGLQQTAQLLVRHVHLAAIHVLQDRLDFRELDVLQHHDRVAALQVGEQALEVSRARDQDHLVALDGAAVRGDGHVGEGLILQQLVEHVEEVRAMVVPAEAVLLRGSVHGRLHLQADYTLALSLVNINEQRTVASRSLCDD